MPNKKVTVKAELQDAVKRLCEDFVQQTAFQSIQLQLKNSAAKQIN